MGVAVSVRSGLRVVCAVVCVCCLSACGSSTPTSPQPSGCSDVSGPLTLAAGGGVVTMRFTLPPSETSDIALYIQFGESNDVAGTTPDWRARFRLYDGATLLGVFEIRSTLAFFKSPESAYGTPDSITGVADFRTIVNGTVDGRVEYSMLSGARVLVQPNLAAVTRFGPPGGPIVGFPATITTRQFCR